MILTIFGYCWRIPEGLTWTLPPVLPVKSIPALLPPPAAADIEMELRVSVCRSISRSNTDSQISFIVLSLERSHRTSAIGWGAGMLLFIGY